LGVASLHPHIEKLKESDFPVLNTSTFFSITNTHKHTYEYVSKNIFACLGIEQYQLLNKGMIFYWSRIHPNDLDGWLSALNELINFTMTEIVEKDRLKLNYTHNYRIKNVKGDYLNIIQNTSPLVFDLNMKPVIFLSHYTVLENHLILPITASVKILNSNNEYETKFFKNFSQKIMMIDVSNRERDIIGLLILNLSSKSIGEKLNISSNTVDTHRRNILKKLNISSTGELIGMLKSNNYMI
jgi:DNA-binding CsgD family transcriptional regulator